MSGLLWVITGCAVTTVGAVEVFELLFLFWSPFCWRIRFRIRIRIVIYWVCNTRRIRANLPLPMDVWKQKAFPRYRLALPRSPLATSLWPPLFFTFRGLCKGKQQIWDNKPPLLSHHSSSSSSSCPVISSCTGRSTIYRRHWESANYMPGYRRFWPSLIHCQTVH